MWGQGLKEEHKTWHHLKKLEKTTGRAVIEKVEAHSGAIVERTQIPDPFISTESSAKTVFPVVSTQGEKGNECGH
jgi:hypothetical protein